MDIGRIGVYVGLAASVLAIVSYVISLRGGRRALLVARSLYAVTAFAALFCFGRLMWLVVHKQFQYDYVFEFVSADLQPPFLYAATWAGQQGSFLLWALWTAVIGGLVAWKAGKWEPRVMPIYITVLSFLFAILALLSPYGLIPRGGPEGRPFDLPWPPTDGNGLNPALQNYWMAIHPPTIFFGFASLAVPFAYGIAAMLWKEYKSWATRVMPWVLLTSATLGVGLFMGGYWAYETQGWHGFWGWDPVENASLFPWLGALALSHGLVVQKSRGGMGRTNLVLAIASWLLFIYGTFLTRSGALSDFSVHAFGMSKNPALTLLPAMVVLYGGVGLGLLVWRWRGIPGRPLSDRMLSRDTALVTAVTLMMVAAVVVAVGTSWPLISRWDIVKPLGHGLYSPKGVRVEGIFYNKIGAALLIPALLVMGIVPYLAWGKTNAEKLLWKLLAPWFAAVALGFGVLAFVWHEAASGFKPDTPPMLVVAVGTLGVFAAIVNIGLAIRVLRARAVSAGGWLAHVGIGILFAGTLITNVYERTESVMLVEGGPPARTSFGYALQYAGWTHDAKARQADLATDPQVASELRHEIEAHDWWQFDHGVRIKLVPIVGGPGVAQADESDPHAGLGVDNPHRTTHMGGTLDEKRSFVVQASVFRNRNARDDDPNAAQTMRWPYIHKDLLRDFYVEVANDPRERVPSVTLRPGESGPIGLPDIGLATGYTVDYKKLYSEGTHGQAGTVFGADMVLHVPDGRSIEVRPGLRLAEGGPQPVNTRIPGLAGLVALAGGIDPSTKEVTVRFSLPELPSVWVVPVAVTNKPMINLVWLGVLLMGAGTVVAMVRRSLEARQGVEMSVPVAAGAVEDAVAADSGAVGSGAKAANGSNGPAAAPTGGEQRRAKQSGRAPTAAE